MAPDGLFVVAEDIDMSEWGVNVCIWGYRRLGRVRNMLGGPICVAGDGSTTEQSFYGVFDRL
jgi:hypothetical protein